MKTGWQRCWLVDISSQYIPIVNIFVELFFITAENVMHIHYCKSCFWWASSPEDGYLFTLWYCELSVIEFLLLFFLQILLFAFLWTYIHALKFSFQFKRFYEYLYHLLHVAFTHTTLPLQFVRVRRVIVAKRYRKKAPPFPDLSVTVSLLLLFTNHVAGHLQKSATCLLCCSINFVKLCLSWLTSSFGEQRLLNYYNMQVLFQLASISGSRLFVTFWLRTLCGLLLALCLKADTFQND